ncbi:MAG: FmdB family transcriptional regulator [Actinobacteria bacterium]|nr:FmdB family transcriptional regulator [Actinomycetota bacterium]
MPTYQYACTACDHDLEAVQSFIDDPLTECPECGGALRKVFGNVGVVFKGSGFYRTDSRGKSESSSTSPDATEAKKSDSTTAPKTESSSTSTGSSTPSPSGTTAA